MCSQVHKYTIDQFNSKHKSAHDPPKANCSCAYFQPIPQIIVKIAKCWLQVDIPNLDSILAMPLKFYIVNFSSSVRK